VIGLRRTPNFLALQRLRNAFAHRASENDASSCGDHRPDRRLGGPANDTLEGGTGNDYLAGDGQNEPAR
jgi:hypothetical protein